MNEYSNDVNQIGRDKHLSNLLVYLLNLRGLCKNNLLH